MAGITDIRTGSVVKWQGEPYVVVFYQHARTAQRKPFARTKLKNLLNGRTAEYTFGAGENIDMADIERRKADFLYKDTNGLNFMDQETFEQFSFPEDNIGESAKYLKEGMVLDVLYFEGKPVTAQVPVKVELLVTQTTDAVKGDTASGNVSKEATLETGAEIRVPMFIKQGEVIRVNTETHEYVERAS